VLLSRSRFIANATKACAFTGNTSSQLLKLLSKRIVCAGASYSEAPSFTSILITWKKPDLGTFLEVKKPYMEQARCEHKAELTTDLISFLGASPDGSVPQDYIEIVEAG